MATIDLRNRTDSDGFVIHFGGKPNEVDTYTFANALVALSDAFREINAQVNQGHSLELRLETVAEGSFRAFVRGVPKSLKNLFSGRPADFVLGILSAFVYDQMVPNDNITINADEVIIEQGGDKIIIPRTAYEASKALPNKRAVKAHIAKAVEVVERDSSVTSLGIYTDLDSKSDPIFLIPRSDFDRVRETALETSEDGRRTKDDRVTLHILKAVLQASSRKWEFVWNGVKISASIDDPIFLADLMQRKYLIGNGDALEVVLRISQKWNDESQVWLNEAYSVTKVIRFIPADKPGRFGFDE